MNESQEFLLHPERWTLWQSRDGRRQCPIVKRTMTDSRFGLMNLEFGLAHEDDDLLALVAQGWEAD